MITRVLFICHGNICRSTMSQMVFQNMVNKMGIADQFHIDSMATSTEEISIPYGTTLDEAERIIIEQNLAVNKNNKTKTAEILI